MKIKMAMWLLAMAELLALCSAHVVHDMFEAGNMQAATSISVKKGDQAAAKHHLHYMALRGLAEVPALILELQDTPYTASYWNRADFNEMKIKYPLGRVPCLVGFDGGGDKAILAQSSSITQYLAEETGMPLMDTAAGRAKVSAAYETVTIPRRCCRLSPAQAATVHMTVARAAPAAPAPAHPAPHTQLQLPRARAKTVVPRKLTRPWYVVRCRYRNCSSTSPLRPSRAARPPTEFTSGARPPTAATTRPLRKQRQP